MCFPTILRLLGLFLIVFSFSMLSPLLVGMIFLAEESRPFYYSFGLTFSVGLFLWMIFRNKYTEIKVHEGFVIVVLFWVVSCSFAAIPFCLGDGGNLPLVDGLFEAVSGLTTTGASILENVDALSAPIKFYRQQLHFLGGMGIIVLAVAILPILGVGGMQLYRAEMPGPIKENKLTPRITETAKSFWFIYLGMNVICIILYKFAGMSLLDAIGEGFSTVATGGFSMHTNSFGYYNNPWIEYIAIIFMILSATNYGLHFLAITQKSFKCYWQDHEFQQYILWLLVFILIVTWAIEKYSVDSVPFIKKMFAVISLATTTGLVSEPFANWPVFIPIVIMLGAIVGGCSGSTCGGLKTIRLMLLRKQVQRELHRLLHPNAVVRIKIGENVLPYYVVQAIWGYVAAFIGFFTILLIVLMSQGINLVTAFGAAVASMANAGAGIGDVSLNYHNLSEFSKYFMMLAMIAGRLEIFTLLILFTPMFWKN
ncbi:MAG: potassium transporter [Legionellales bacterium]|nr:potassium transporter [Legionellales bacterium]